MLSLKNINLLELEDLRDEKEIKLYFKTKNIELTNEDIEKLRNLFIVENNKYSLTMQQLDEIAGGNAANVANAAIVERAFSSFRRRENMFAVDKHNVIEILQRYQAVDAVPESKGLPRVDVGTEPKIAVPTSESPEIEVVESHHGNIGSSTTGGDVHAVDLPKSEQLRVEQHGQLTLKKHSILGFGFGGEIKIEDSHVRALFPSIDREGHVSFTPDVRILVSKYADMKIRNLDQAKKDASSVGSPSDNAVTRISLMHADRRYQEQISRFNELKSGKQPITHEELIRMFNEVYGKEGLAESLTGDIFGLGKSGHNPVRLEKFNTEKQTFYYKDKGDRQHLVDLGGYSLVTEGHLNPVIIEAMQGLNKHDTYRIGDTEITHIGTINKNTDRKRHLYRVNLEDGSKQVFDSNGNSLLKVNELGRVERMEPGLYCIIAKMMDKEGRDTLTFAGATFKRGSENVYTKTQVFSFVDAFGDIVRINLDDNSTQVYNNGDALFAAQGDKVLFIFGCEHIMKRLENKKPGETIDIAGVTFTKISKDEFGYVDTNDEAELCNQEAGAMTRLFKITDGKVACMEKNGCEIVTKLLTDKGPGETVDIAGVTFTKISDGEFGCVDINGEAELCNQETGAMTRLFKITDGKVACMEKNGCEIVTKLLTDKEKITIFGVTFTKISDGVFSYINDEGQTVLRNSEGTRLFNAKGDSVWKMEQTGCKYVAEKLESKNDGETVDIAGVKFTKIADGVFSYTNDEGQTVLRNSEGTRLFNAKGDSVWKMEQTGCKYVAEQLESKNDGETVDIAGVKFTKIADGVFSYINDECKTVVRNSEGTILFSEKGSVEITKIADGVLSCGNSYGRTVVVNSEGTRLFSAIKDRVWKMEQTDCKYVAKQLEGKNKGETVDIAGVKFTKIADGVFSYINVKGQTVVRNSEGTILFSVEGSVEITKIADGVFRYVTDDGFTIKINQINDSTEICNSEDIRLFSAIGDCVWNMEETGCECVARQLENKERGDAVTIAGVTFTKIADREFIYKTNDGFTVRVNQKYTSREVYDSSNARLFSAIKDRVWEMEQSGCKYVAKRLEDKKDGDTVTIAGVTFTKIADEVFKYNLLFDFTAVRNLAGEELFEVKDEKIWNMRQPGCKYVAQQLVEKSPGETVIVADVIFKKKDEGKIVYVDYQSRTEKTGVYNPGRTRTSWRAKSREIASKKKSYKFVTNGFIQKRLGDTIIVDGITYTNVWVNEFGYVDNDGYAVIMNSRGDILFKAKAGKVSRDVIFATELTMSSDGCKYILDKLNPGTIDNIAGVTFTKIADEVFSYINEEGKTVVKNSNGETMYEAKDGKICLMSKKYTTIICEYIAKELTDMDINGKKEILGANITKIAEGVFSYINDEGQTVLRNSEGTRLFSAKGDSVWKMEQTGCKYVAEKLESKNDGETVDIAGVKFTKISKDVFGYVDNNDYAVLYNQRTGTATKLFRIEDGKVAWMEKNECEIVTKLLTDKEKITIFGVTFTKIADGVLSYGNSYGYTVVVNSKGNILFRVKGNVAITEMTEGVFRYTNDEGQTVVKNSKGETLYEAEAGKICRLNGEHATIIWEYISKELADMDINGKKVILGANITKIPDGVLSYENSYGRTVVVNSQGTILFK